MTPYKDIERILQTRSIQLANEFITILKRNLTQHNATGNLIDSVQYERKFWFFGEVRVTANRYILFLDKGTKPHTPPFSKIYEWVIAKKLNLVRRGKIYTPRRTAYTIMNSIKKHGTKPYGVLQRSYEEFEQRTGVKK